jgi:uncharacterized membrane protein
VALVVLVQVLTHHGALQQVRDNFQAELIIMPAVAAVVVMLEVLVAVVIVQRHKCQERQTQVAVAVELMVQALADLV